MDGKGSMLRDDDRGEEKKKSIIGDQCKEEEEGNKMVRRLVQRMDP